MNRFLLPPNEVRFSQNSVSEYYSVADGSRHLPVEAYEDSPPYVNPILVTSLTEGVYTTYDNRRLVSARFEQQRNPEHQICVRFETGDFKESDASLISETLYIAWPGERENAGHVVGGYYVMEATARTYEAAVQNRCLLQGSTFTETGSDAAPMVGARFRKTQLLAASPGGVFGLHRPHKNAILPVGNTENLPAEVFVGAQKKYMHRRSRPSLSGYSKESLTFQVGSEMKARATDDEWSEFDDDDTEAYYALEDLRCDLEVIPMVADHNHTGGMTCSSSCSSLNSQRGSPLVVHKFQRRLPRRPVV